MIYIREMVHDAVRQVWPQDPLVQCWSTRMPDPLLLLLLLI